MPTITVDAEVFAALQKEATPLVDTANDVLRRLLRLEKHPASAVKLTATGKTGRDFTPQREFRRPILEALVEVGGTARTGDVLDRVREKMKSRLTSGDLSETSSGKIRYRHHAEFERLAMRDEGLIDRASPHGVWEITSAGRDYLKRAAS